MQSIVDGEINVAQAAAFMVLLHSKVVLHVQNDLLVAVVQVILHTLCAILTRPKLLLACLHSKHKCPMWPASEQLVGSIWHYIGSQEVTWYIVCAHHQLYQAIWHAHAMKQQSMKEAQSDVT